MWNLHSLYVFTKIKLSVQVFTNFLNPGADFSQQETRVLCGKHFHKSPVSSTLYICSGSDSFPRSLCAVSVEMHGSTVSSAAKRFSPWMPRFLMPWNFLNFSSQQVDALNLRSAVSVFNCVEKCFAFSWRSGPEIGVPVDLFWINQAYRDLSNCWSLASFRGTFVLILCLFQRCQ